MIEPHVNKNRMIDCATSLNPVTNRRLKRVLLNFVHSLYERNDDIGRVQKFIVFDYFNNSVTH